MKRRRRNDQRTEEDGLGGLGWNGDEFGGGEKSG